MALFAVLPRLIFRVDDRGFVWFGVSDQYRLYQRRLTGDTVRIVERIARPPEVSSQERGAIIEDLRKTNSLPQQNLIPSNKPFYVRLLPDSAGSLLVMRISPAEVAGTQFDVFDPEGRYLGQTAIPAKLVGHACSHHHRQPPARCYAGCRRERITS